MRNLKLGENMQNDKQTPKTCQATMCCRATAELQQQVDAEKTVADPQKTLSASLDEFIESLKSEKNDENPNDKE